MIIQGMEPSPACLNKLGDLPNVWFMTRRSQTYAGDFVEPDNDANGRTHTTQHAAAPYCAAAIDVCCGCARAPKLHVSWYIGRPHGTAGAGKRWHTGVARHTHTCARQHNVWW